MVGLRLVSGVLALLLALYVSAQEESANLESVPDNPFFPVWVPCNYTAVQGPYCEDCSTRVICTAVGGLVRGCWFPGKAHCVDGQCVSEPSAECAPEPSSTPGTTPAV